ncbi:MAG: RHS repeat protein, partial [Gammaproteobacteria bacterium]|nr:RHS repeat protein [Gammaproteobacteria bacterium]
AGTPEERTITTDWHPDFRLPDLVTEPGRTIDYDYYPQGLLHTRTETDAATGENRTTTYTYYTEADGLLEGLLKSVDGPRTDVNDLITYEYYDQGDFNGNLEKITKFLDDTPAFDQIHVTRITGYDPHGRPTTIVDPNGLETILTYSPRGRLRFKTIGGEETEYKYDPANNLERVTLPDGSYLKYGYDAAHRLESVEDNLGNRIVYTLDAMGNSSPEEIFDSAGILRRTQTREYDELN